MENCIFCKIIRGELPADKVYEDDNFIAFQSLVQSTQGHTLIVPKEHSTDSLTMRPELGQELITLTQKIGNAMIQGLPCDGFNICVNTKAAAGQEIFHTHFHLIPRRTGDGRGDWPKVKTTPEDRTLFAEKIISKL